MGYFFMTVVLKDILNILMIVLPPKQIFQDVWRRKCGQIPTNKISLKYLVNSNLILKIFSKVS